jgi:hypothetical protein
MLKKSMKKPSRYMPKYNERPAGVIGSAILLLFIGAMLWAIWVVPYLLLFVPIFFATDHFQKKQDKKHFKKIIKERQNESICTFTRHFEFREIDTWVIRAVYEQLQNYLKDAKEGFPIQPTDDVFTDLLIDEDDFEFLLVEEIAERTGRSLEQAESNPYYGKANIVENLVYFFNEQPKVKAT